MHNKKLKRIIAYLLSVLVVILLFIGLIFAKKYLEKKSKEKESQNLINTLESMLLCKNYGGILEKTTSLNSRSEEIDTNLFTKYIEIGNAYEYLNHIEETIHQNINPSFKEKNLSNSILWYKQLKAYVQSKSTDELKFGNEIYLVEMQENGKGKILMAYNLTNDELESYINEE